VDKERPISTARDFLRFLLTGGFAALVNLASRYVLTPSLGFGGSVLVAYFIGMITAYVLFRLLVFGGSDRSLASEVYRFTFVNVVALGLVWIVSVGLARVIFPAIGYAWHAEDVAHLVGVCIPAISSYIGHAKYTFRRD